MYGDAAKMIHGWFTPPPVTQPNDKRHWLQVFADGIADCKNYDEIKEFLSDVEGMLNGDSKSMAKLALTNSDKT